MLPVSDLEIFAYPQQGSLRMGPESKFQIHLCFIYPYTEIQKVILDRICSDFICECKFYGMVFSSCQYLQALGLRFEVFRLGMPGCYRPGLHTRNALQL